MFKAIKKLITGLFPLLAIFSSVVPSSYAEIKMICKFGGDRPGPRAICVFGNMCYTFNNGGFVRAWDISDLANIKMMSQYEQKDDRQWQAKSDFIKFQDYHGNAGGISQGYNMAVGTFSGKKLAFVGTGHQGIQVLDVTDPYGMYMMGGRPEYGASIEGACGMCQSIKVRGDYIFKNLWGGFAVMKYSPFIAMQKDGGPFELVTILDYFGGPEALDYVQCLDISRDGRYLYVARDGRMDVYNITDAKKPLMIYSYTRTRYPYTTETNKGVSVKAYKNKLFFGTTKDVRFFDISNPAAPKPFKDSKGKEVMYPVTSSVLDMRAFKNYLFVYYGPIEKVAGQSTETGVEVVDISNPQEPKFVESFLLGVTGRTDYFRRLALISKKGILILSADAFYVFDVSSYTK